MSIPIPFPKVEPLIGQLRSIDVKKPIQSYMRMTREYGPFFRIQLPVTPKQGRYFMVSSYQLVNELCDTRRFDKKIHRPLQNIRAFAGDGLFTAHTQEPNWQKAHNILMPAFGPMPIREMFGEMQDICEQMLVRWERFGPEAEFEVSDHMTRLTLDTIALCGFGARFNSFYQEKMHPFVEAMVNALDHAGDVRPLPAPYRQWLDEQNQHNVDVMNALSDQLIQQRRADPQGHLKTDLLARMLGSKDPSTGETLSDENIRYQMATFLIAGHETTSGLLSFAIYFLLKHPEVFAKARAQVDAVLGDRLMRVTDLPKLGYIDQILRESLRLWPTASAFGISPLEPTTLGGVYDVYPDDTFMILVPSLHRDLAVWGPDVEAFQPERFSPENARYIPKNAWKPFGNGQRSCIGRPFAMQEATLVLTSILQRFDLELVDPNYQLKVKETLTLKPEGLHVRAKLRPNKRIQSYGFSAERHHTETSNSKQGAKVQQLPMLLLYGSESGSSATFANQIAADAAAYGCEATVKTLDEAAGNLPTTGAVVIVTASYEGQPPANARRFVAWLEEQAARQEKPLQGVRYAVFGCGNKDWHRTYQAIPTLIDETLEQAGATRFKARGAADASADFFGDFDQWYETFWTDVAAHFGEHALDLHAEATPAPADMAPTVQSAEQNAAVLAKVSVNKELVNMQHPLGRSKRHLELELPADQHYRTGDYLSVWPRNSSQNVERVLRRFNLAADDQHEGLSLQDWLSERAELSQPITKKQMERLIAATACPPEKMTLEHLHANYEQAVLACRLSALDVLERVQGCELAFGDFLSLLPPLKARQYSISSSALVQPHTCSLTVSVVDAPAWSGQGQFCGVASSFLRQVAVGQQVAVAVKPSHFQPPSDPSTPMVMIAAGSGIAPFRAFVQERAAQQQAGQSVGCSLLFFGCDHPEVDWLYHDEWQAWEQAGLVKLHPAFSEQPDGDVRFVQHRLWQDRAEVVALFAQGAQVYLCGDGKQMAPAVRETLERIGEELQSAASTANSHEVSSGVSQQWAAMLSGESGRLKADVFS